MKMKNTIKTTLIFTLFAILSCKKSKQQPAPIDPKQEEKPTIPKEQKNLIPIEISSSGITITFKYIENTGLLSEVNLSTGRRFLITNTNNMPVKLELFPVEDRAYYVEYRNADNRISRANQFTSNGKNSTPADKFQMSYDGYGQLTNIKRYLVDNSLASEKQLSYTEEGLLKEITTVERDYTTTDDYSYDVHKGVFKNVKYLQILLIEMKLDAITFGANTLLQYSCPSNPALNKTYAYTYNDDGYPIKQTIKSAGSTQVFDIKYAEIK
ncbi:MAG: hypothetical protein EOO92_07360 [Pedobacter sp.]|nr:MAG: hypothetical protein EOO92_07360 [Pedobacter sp.]